MKNTMTNTVKMQHYVPRSYLQNFATNTSNGAPTVYCFSKPDRNQFKTSVSNIGGENYFYDIPEDPDQEFESQLASIEGEFSQACNALLETEDLTQLTENDRTAIAYSVAVQDLRTRENREQLLETVSKLHGHLENESLTSEMAEQLDELQELSTDEGITRFQRDLMKDGAWDLAEIILQMKWILLKKQYRNAVLDFRSSCCPPQSQ